MVGKKCRVEYAISPPPLGGESLNGEAFGEGLGEPRRQVIKGRRAWVGIVRPEPGGDDVLGLSRLC
jgi:hypothetical protein